MHYTDLANFIQLQKNPQKFSARQPSILITGASGFIGSKLVSYFAAHGIEVKAMSRRCMHDTLGVKYVQADAFNTEQLILALQGVEIAYYLLHSMEGSKEQWRYFAERERIQAENFAKAAVSTGVKRIIYLGGLVNNSIEMSKHMQSRKRVGETLANSGIPVTELRASLTIGAGGSSYSMLRYLAERLPLMVCPKWVESLAQPIAVDDVVAYLFKCVDHPETAGKIFEIGGPDIMSYKELLRAYGRYVNKNIRIIQIPFLTTRLSSYWVDLVTPVEASLARPLIDSLVHNTTVTNDNITKVIPVKLHSVVDAIDIATKEMSQESVLKKDSDNRTGHAWNRKILLMSLLIMSAIGSSYYWLDTRLEVYGVGWLLLSSAWFFTIAFAMRFVYYKTRLGYFIAGVLSWITLGFWLMDNFYVVFQTSLVADQPNLAMTVRNFVGVGIAGLCIASSHNAFHKIRAAVM